MRTLCIIPARGGSKRIPRKNIKPFLGTPIIQYSIKAALGSEIFDKVIVSTDDEEIANISLSGGASVPFKRSPENSNDFAGLVEVVLEVLERLDDKYDLICCLLPTAPFVTPELLKRAYQKLIASEANAIVPIVQFPYPIQRAFRINSAANIEMIWPENYIKRSQELEPAYHDAGQFYFIRQEILTRDKMLFPKNTVPFEVSELHAQDIDNDTDWAVAEFKYKTNLLG